MVHEQHHLARKLSRSRSAQPPKQLEFRSRDSVPCNYDVHHPRATQGSHGPRQRARRPLQQDGSVLLHLNRQSDAKIRCTQARVRSVVPWIPRDRAAYHPPIIGGQRCVADSRPERAQQARVGSACRGDHRAAWSRVGVRPRSITRSPCIREVADVDEGDAPRRGAQPLGSARRRPRGPRRSAPSAVASRVGARAARRALAVPRRLRATLLAAP